MSENKLIINLLQMVSFLTFIILGIIRCFVDSLPFVFFISCISFLAAVIVTLFTTRNHLMTSMHLWKEKKEHRVKLVEIIIVLVTLIGAGIFILLGIFNKISPRLSDVLSIFAFGISLSNDYLSKRFSSILHYSNEDIPIKKTI
ncbi:hypothetical protein ACIQZD_22135 [Peribacillus sp. NPDC096447]|uniref:hypothetical protein n=1 Tax=Peribacillus sp. NPDC096447 TaxID=3364394 RepID=UPI003802B317